MAGLNLKRIPVSRGQSLTEYGLVVALVALLCIAALTSAGDGIRQMLSNLGGTVAGIATAKNAPPGKSPPPSVSPDETPIPVTPTAPVITTGSDAD